MAQRGRPLPATLERERPGPHVHPRDRPRSSLTMPHQFSTVRKPPPPLPPRRRLAPPQTASSPSNEPTHTPSPPHSPGAKVRSKFRTQSLDEYYVNDNELPPPVPTTPRPRVPGFPHNRPEPHKSQSMDDQFLSVQEEDTALTLCQLVENYSKFFPVRVQVHKGFYTDRIQVAAGDGYSIHFLKQAKVGVIKDSIGHEYIIPLNSAIEFGLIYGPSVPSTPPATFNSVADILASHDLPKIVCTMKSYVGHDPKSSVDEHEVLVITGVHKAKLGLGKVTLKAFSLTKNQDKMLPKECTGSFTTDPYTTRLHLAEIMKYIPDALPVTARMYVNFEDEDFELPNHLISEDITLTRQFTETSLIATPFADPDSTTPLTPDVLVDIPVSLDIEVNVIPPEKDEVQKLYLATREIYQDFNPSKLTTYKDAPTADAFEAQSQFYSVVWEGHEKEGLLLQKPTMAYIDPDDYEMIDFGPLASNRPRLPIPSPLQPPPLPPHRESTHAPPPPPRQPTPPLLPPPREPTPPLLPPPREPTSSLRGPPSPQILPPPQESPTAPLLPPPRESTARAHRKAEIEGSVSPPGSHSSTEKSPRSPRHPLSSSPEPYEDQVLKPVSVQGELSSIRQELNCVASLVDSLVHTCASLQDEVRELKQRVSELSKEEHTATNSRQRQNQEILAEMTPVQILQLLEVMGMSNYNDTFAKESIDGAVLHECDESVLENELGIQSKLHRIRLLKVITGHYSPLSILEGGDPYVFLDPTQK